MKHRRRVGDNPVTLSQSEGPNSQDDQIEGTSRWLAVLVAFGAGVIAATHIGKLPPALGVIQADLGAGLVMAGWIASMISAVGALTGLVIGSVSDRIGPRRVLLGGLATLCVGSTLGGLALSAPYMLLARFIEGLGFTATTVSAGIVIARVTVARDRSRALAIWASFMPLGFSAMLLISALLLDEWGWRSIWFVSAGCSGVWGLVVFFGIHAKDGGEARRDEAISFVASLSLNLRQTGALLAAACYALYAAQHIGMMVWLPSMLLETHEVSVFVAATLAAMVLLANASGNYMAAWWLGRGVPIWRLLLMGALGMLCVELQVFRDGVPDAMRMILLLVFGVAGGLIPASVLAAPPIYAPSPALVGVLSGLMVMATNLGQLAGPPLLATSRLASEDWSGVALILASLAVIAMLCAALSARFEIAARAQSTRWAKQ